MKIISIIGVCTIIAYIILALHVAIEISQLRLANNHKCSSHAPKISLLERFESVEEVFLSPKIMEMPPRNEIACFVMTSAKSRNARSVIRRSWGKVIKPLFVLTMTGDSSTIDFLTNEAKVFDDMIVIRADESLRLAVAFTYFVENFSESKYFLYTHDDVLVNPENLYEFLNDEATPVSAMIGNVRRFPGRSWIYDSMLSYMQTRYDIEYLRDSAFIIPGEAQNPTKIIELLHWCFELQASWLMAY